MKKLLGYTSVFALAGCMMGGDSSSLMGFGGGGVERGDMPQELADRSSSVTGMNLWDNNSSGIVAWLEGLIGDIGGGSSSIFGFTRESSVNQGISQTQIDTFQSTKYNNAVKILKNTLAIWNADDDATTSKEDLRRAWLILGVGKDEGEFESMYNKDGAEYVMHYIQSKGEPEWSIGKYFDLTCTKTTTCYVKDWNPTFYNIEDANFIMTTKKTFIDKFSFVLTDDVISGIKYKDGKDNEFVLRRTTDNDGKEVFVDDDNIIAVRYKSYGKGLLKYADFGEIEVWQNKSGEVLTDPSNNYLLETELFAGGYDDPGSTKMRLKIESGKVMNFAGKAIGKANYRLENLDEGITYSGSDTWYTDNATIMADGYGNVALKMPFLTRGRHDGGDTVYDVNVYSGNETHIELLDGSGLRVAEATPDKFGVGYYGIVDKKPSEATGYVSVQDFETSNDGHYRRSIDLDAVAGGASGRNFTDGSIQCEWCNQSDPK